MTLQEFIDKYNGKYLEVGGSPNAINQCVDLANGYIIEVLKQQPIFNTNAQDFPSKADKNIYDFIPNSATAVPKAGDIIIWKSPDGIGHIAVCADDKATTTSFTSFDENWPLKSPCKLVTHPYTGTYKVTGWLRCKILPVEENMTEQEKLMLDFIRVNKITEGQLREGYGYIKDGTVANLSKEIEGLKQSLKDMVSRVEMLEAENKANNDLILDWQSRVESANSKISKLEAEVKLQSDEKNTWKNRYEAKLKETADKMTVKQLFNLIVKKLTTK